MKKKLLPLLLAGCICCSLAAVMPYAASTAYAITDEVNEKINIDDLYFTEYEDHATVSSCKFEAEGEIVIPYEVNGKPVTEINYVAFKTCYGVTSVIIPDTVTSIGEEAFELCTSLKKISIPETVNYIGCSAFSETLWLENMKKENPLVIVNDILVDGTDCKGEVIIPDGIRVINDEAFYECGSITSVILPDTVTDINDGAFKGCTNLEKISIPESVTSFELEAFYETPWLEKQRQENPLVIINDVLIDGTACEGEVIIPDNVHTIAEWAFYMCKTVNSVVIPNTVTNIGKTAFYECTNLESITLPENLEYIPISMFVRCDNLRSIHIPESVTKIGDNAFLGCSGLKEIIIPENVTEIGNEAFRFSALTSITIPDSVTEIKGFAFSNCTDLTSVHFGTGLKSIETMAFYKCSNLSEINLPENLQIIGQQAFALCDSLTSIVIPASVNKICGWAFFGCESLESVTIKNPDCDIAKDEYTFAKGSSTLCAYELSRFTGTIYGYSGSTAQTYAESFGYDFEAISEVSARKGDVNSDGAFSISDFVMLRKWMLSIPDARLTNKKAADLNNDGLVNVFDLCIMKRVLIEEQKNYI